MNIMWKVLHSRWTLVLWVEWSGLQRTLCGRYCTAGGQWYCGLNGLCYIEQYLEGTAQQVDCGFGLNGVCYSEHYVEDNIQQVDSGIVG